MTKIDSFNTYWFWRSWNIGYPKMDASSTLHFQMNNGSCMTLLYIHKKIYIHIYVYRWYRYYILHIHLVHRNHYIISSSSSKICQKKTSAFVAISFRGSSKPRTSTWIHSLAPYLEGNINIRHPDPKKTKDISRNQQDIKPYLVGGWTNPFEKY